MASNSPVAPAAHGSGAGARHRRRSVRPLWAGLLIAGAVAGGWGLAGRRDGALYVPIAAAPGRSIASGTAAIIVSGDMGFGIGMGRRIAQRLAGDGVPVLGVDARLYFRERRTPAEATALLASAIRRATAGTGAVRLVLIGQSFGADMVQVGLAGLPPELRRRLALVILVVPGATIAFRASLAETLGLTADEASALPTARRLDWLPTWCVRGSEETDSLCPLLRAPNVRRVVLPGGHPLHRDTDALYAVVRSAVRGVAGSR